MTIQRKELLESLKQCMPGIETGSAVLQGADSFVFHNGRIFTYNDSISVTVPIKNEGLLEEGLEGCVRAEEFFKIINKVDNPQVTDVKHVGECGCYTIKTNDGKDMEVIVKK